MSKRALIASLASMAIIPLQATQVLAFGDSKTVRESGYQSLLFLKHTSALFLLRLFVQVCQVPAILQVFVAGATGNTGKRVVQQLSGKGIKVLAGTRVTPWPAEHSVAN